ELVRKEREAAENARLTAAAFAVAAVAPGDTMGMAAVEISNAEMALGALEEGTLAYAQALLALNQAKRALADLELQAANNAALAAVDSRDTVGRARVAVQNAAREMRHAGAGSPEYYAALEAYRTALVQ